MPLHLGGNPSHHKTNGKWWNDLVNLINTGWHTGQCYTSSPALGMQCKGCNGITFEVAHDEYWTGIRCPTCGYETEVHEG